MKAKLTLVLSEDANRALNSDNGVIWARLTNEIRVTACNHLPIQGVRDIAVEERTFPRVGDINMSDLEVLLEYPDEMCGIDERGLAKHSIRLAEEIARVVADIVFTAGGIDSFTVRVEPKISAGWNYTTRNEWETVRQHLGAG